MEIYAYFCKNFDDHEETEEGQVVRRLEAAAAEGDEAAEVRAAAVAGGAVQDAVQGTEGVRRADGRGTVQPAGVAAGAVGGVADGRDAGVA